jgi:hypothetical protein
MTLPQNLLLLSMTYLVCFTMLMAGCRRDSAYDSELKQLTDSMTEQQKADFQEILVSSDADARSKLIQEMLRERK